MKKLINFLLSISIFSTTITVTSCNIGETSTKNYLSSLKDFDWANDSRGYDIDVPTVDNSYQLTNSNNINFIDSDQEVKPEFIGSYFDYDVLNTNFKEKASLTKQAVTGSPINKIYSSGNFWSDFGVTSKARKGLRANTILDWKNPSDIDYKYGVSAKKIQKRTKTALKAVSSQDERISFGDIRDHSRINGSFQATNMGTKNIFEKSISNFQYRDYIFDWGQHGNISPPAADVIEAGHINGTPVFGLMFFSAYGGLTRNDMQDLIEKNNDGTYKIVDILIDMAVNYGFDGWFLNDEANGGWPNGTVTPANYAYDVVKQYKEKTQSSNNDVIKNLKILYYKDGGTLNATNGVPSDGEFAKNSEYADIIQTDFRVTPNNNVNYIQKHNINKNRVHSLVDLALSYGYIGSFDWRNFVYAKKDENVEGSNYDKENYQSLSSFSGSGSGEYGSQAFQIANQNVDLSDYKQRMNSYVYAQQVANQYESYMFSGLNGDLSENDNGISSLGYSNIRTMIMADPRIDTGKSVPDDDNVYNNLYDFEKNQGYISKSFGIGNIIQEFTTLNDENLDEQKSIKSNFSLGNGVKFIDRNNDGKIIGEANNYLWTNRRLTDLLPTYTYDIKFIENDIYKNLPINAGLNGFYDYYDVYKKGNSIALGSKLNMDGSISDATWVTNKIYDWNIMGSNLSKDDYSLSFILKASDNTTNQDSTLDSFADLSFINTYTSDGKNEKVIEIKPDEIVKLQNGWYKISLNKISTNRSNILAKIGLRINPKKESFKLNIGEFNLSKAKIDIPNNEILSLKSEAIIKRNDDYLNVRLSWEAKNDMSDFYEVYYYLDNKWYRVGESSIKAAYFPNIPFRGDELKFGIKYINKFNDSNDIKTFKIKL
ncbi:hypothetical protein SCORR_v1c06340 [Spiroplasma corruscae]|uniref:Cytosolic endo-beta-N-acetylglucosaminidase TIM barrel domain-containing protein n=1 Tax=Spiroplasma corruscae TaxID=216934 RepID=A0A222EPN9_9MOLU|nr:hypothetical protein [Spiroplasma corruscae]ASP28406.1 hypothetical protein SCORR_v1c06340 [Spiroplasma corruscae]